MIPRQLELTTALRPNLFADETLLFVQNSVGLYKSNNKLERYQDGSVYLTDRRICYVDNTDPRKFSIGFDLKQVERAEFYSGFLKSSPKITLFPKVNKRFSQAISSPVPRYASSSDGLVASAATPPRSTGPTPAPARDINATWICPICGLSNPVPANFDPSVANEHTPLPPCQACGIKPTLVHLVKATIAAMSNRPAGLVSTSSASHRSSTGPGSFTNGTSHTDALSPVDSTRCPRCTFQNHPSLSTCEICGASLLSSDLPPQFTQDTQAYRSESPGPSLVGSIVGDETIEMIKLSFRGGGEKVFHERLKGALVQRKWLLQGAPPVPRPAQSTTPINGSPWQTPDVRSGTGTPQQRVVGIAGLERRGAELRENNQTVIGTAFEDLEALMTSAKEVIAMADQFARQTDGGTNGDSAEARTLLSDSASALGLVTTKDMLGSGSSSETLYITELARNLAELLTDDRKGVLRREGGIMSLVDLWAVFNRTRNGIELVSPLDFEKAATMWESLHLPVRLRRFKSGLLVIQEKSRTDEKTIMSLLAWLRERQSYLEHDAAHESHFGRGMTAQETAERFGWSVGIATEELEMAEEAGALCRDQCLDGTRFWENHFMHTFADTTPQRLNPVQMINELSI